MEGVTAVLESAGKTCDGSAEKGGAEHRWFSVNVFGRSWADSGPWFRRKRQDGNRRGGEG